MTRHILCFVLLLPLGVLHAGDKAATNTPSAIPWNQIGAKAGADYQGDGLAVTPTPSGAQLHCVFQRLDGEATPKGLWLTSTVSNTTPDRFRVTATAIGRTESPARGSVSRSNDQTRDSAPSLSRTLLVTGTVTISGQTVRFTRPGLTEEYTVSMDGLRQDFIVEQSPETRSAGFLTCCIADFPIGEPFESPPCPTDPRPDDVSPCRFSNSALGTPHSALLLTLSVTSATVEPAPDGARLVLANSGRKIAYTRLRVTDATGKELPAHIEVCPNLGVRPLARQSAFDDGGSAPRHSFSDGGPGAATLELPDPLDFLKPGQNETDLPTPAAADPQLAIVINDSDAIYPLRIDPTFSDANWSALGSGMNDYVFALAASGSTLYAGGFFMTAGGVTANNIAQWNGTNWSALGSGVNDTVYALAVSGSNLYAGGQFTTAGVVAANYIAQWNGSSWSPLGSGVTGQYPDTAVWALAVSGSTLYAGGVFTTAGSNAANRIAQWNGTNWSALGFGMDEEVRALAVSGSTVYAGGYFDTAGSVTVNGIAQWNGTNWSALGSGMGGNVPYVWALAVSGSTLYAGGFFTTAGGVAANNIAQWNGTNWSTLGSGMNDTATHWVYTLAVSGSTLYAGGQFTTAGGVAAGSIAQWDGTNWSALGSGMNSQVNALAVSGSTLYAGGDFTMAGTNVSYYVAEGFLAGTPISLAIITTNAAFGFTNGLFGFDVSGPSGSNIVIQASTNLSNWIALQTNLLNSNGLLYFSDSHPTNRQRFYRAMVP